MALATAGDYTPAMAIRWLFLASALAAAGSARGGFPQGSEPPWPRVIEVSPSSGPPGTQVTITGLFFRPGATVLVGGVDAPVHSVTESRIVATVGPHAPGRVSVEVENRDGRNGVRGWAFRYEAE